MKQIFRQTENRKKEKALVYAYGILAFLAGVFLSTFDILVHANFLEILGYKYLSSSYIFAGAIGIILSLLYSKLYRRIHTRPLNSELSTIILVSAGSYILVSLISQTIINSYVGMIILFPVNILILLTIWRFGRKMLSPVQSREIMPKIKLFHLSGIALGGLVTTLSLYYYSSFTFISIICFLSTIFYWVCQQLLFKIHSQAKLFPSGKERFVPVSNNLSLFFTSRIAKYLFLYAVLSAIVGFSIHFTFINVARAGFKDVVGLSKFYGLFIAVLMFFIFGVDQFLIRKILYSYDSPYSLVLLPFITIIIMAFAIAGYYFLSRFQPHEHFTVFFLLLTIAKVGVESTRTIIQVPSLRVLFQTMDIRYRQVIYPQIEGSAVMLGLFISGLIIFPLTFLSFFTLNVVIYWTAVITIIWIIAGIRLVKAYKKKQSETLEGMRYNKAEGLVSEVSYKERLWNTFTGTDLIKIDHLLNTLLLIKPMVYQDYLARLLSHHEEEIKNKIIIRIVNERITSLIPKIQKKAEELPAEEKELLVQVIEELKYGISRKKTLPELRDILFSDNVNKRIELAISLTLNDSKDAENILFELVKDVEPKVQDIALKILAQKEKTGFNYVLLDFLYPEKYNSYVMDIIAKSGDDAYDHLERVQMLSETPDVVQIRIIKIMGRIGTKRAINNIITNITNQDRYIQLQSIQALVDGQFQASKKNRYKLLNLVVKQIGIITQNLNYYNFLRKKPKLNLLAEAYRQEIDFNYDLLFKFLSIIYNPHIIASLRKIFLDGSQSSINHGIEIADQYFDEDIKHVIFPLLENLTIENRLKRLEHYFIQPRINTGDIIRTTLTQDYKTLSLYPRAQAMMYIFNNRINGYENELVFNAYHSEYILSETAVYVLSKQYPEILNNILNEEGVEKNLKQLILSIDNIKEEELLLYSFSSLKKYPVFNSLTEHVALQLAYKGRKVLLQKNKEFRIPNLIGKESLFLCEQPVFKGDNNYVFSCFNNFADIDLINNYGISTIIPEKDIELWLFPSDVVKELLFDHVNFTDIYFNVVENFRLISN